METNKKVAKKIVADIVADLEGRKGFDHFWDELDEDVQAEIIDTWENIILDGIK